MVDLMRHMPQHRGRPTARYALLHRLKRARTAQRLTREELALLGLRTPTPNTPATRRQLNALLRPILEAADPDARRGAEETRRLLETQLVPLGSILTLVASFEETCAGCGVRFLPKGRRRRKNVRALCGGCAPKAKREADRLRIARKRRAKVPPQPRGH